MPTAHRTSTERAAAQPNLWTRESHVDAVAVDQVFLCYALAAVCGACAAEEYVIIPQ
jgi:hypothetical protein